MVVRHWFLTRHSNPYVYIPNLIGLIAPSWVAELTKVLRNSQIHCGDICATPTRFCCSTGYVRIASALYAFAIALYSPAQCVLFYFFGWGPARLVGA